MLTDRGVKALQGVNKMIADSGGLYLRLSRHGTKSFVYRTSVGGKTKYVSLGTYPNVSLADAREKAKTLQGHVIGDRDVSFAVSEYLKSLRGVYEHPEQVKQRLEKDVVPFLGKKRLTLVTADDLTGTLQRIVDRGARVSANRTLADVRHLFQFCYQKGWVQNDVSARITRKVVGGPESSREVVLTDKEIQDLVKVMRSDRFEVRTRIATLVLLVTGQRSTEVLGISKDEVQGHWWTIPAERTKNGKAQKVYLSHLALWLLRKVDFNLGGDHRTLSRAFKRMGVRYIPRDLRRSVATKMSDLSVMPHVIEKVLNHTMEGVMAVYNRAEFLPEKKEAWRLWSCRLLMIVHHDYGGNQTFVRHVALNERH